MLRFLKNTTVLLLCAVFVFVMVGCSLNVPEKDKGSEGESFNVTEESSKVTEESSKVTEESSKVTEESSKVTEESSKVSEGKAQLTRGENDGVVYRNRFLGFRFTKPESWMYYTDEEVAALTNMTAEMLESDKFAQTLAENSSVYDMMAVDLQTGSNVYMGYENLSQTFLTNITVKQYVDMLKQQLANVSGMTFEFSDTIESVKIGNVTFERATGTALSQGVTIQQVYYFKKVDNYMCFLIISISGGSKLADIEAMFS